jgi:hypothetical protein
MKDRIGSLWEPIEEERRLAWLDDVPVPTAAGGELEMMSASWRSCVRSPASGVLRLEALLLHGEKLVMGDDIVQLEAPSGEISSSYERRMERLIVRFDGSMECGKA